MQLDYPFHIDGRDRTAMTTEADHVRDLIEQILFTSPGERVNRPDFGAGVLQFVFGPNSPEKAAATEFMVQGALQQHLGNRVSIEEVEAQSMDSRLIIKITYLLTATGQTVSETFERGGSG